MQNKQIGRIGKVLLIMASVAILAGCTGRTYNTVRLADENAKVVDHQFITPQGFKKIAGNKYPIPTVAGKKASTVEDKNGKAKAHELPARTADNERISILPPGSHF